MKATITLVFTLLILAGFIIKDTQKECHLSKKEELVNIPK